MPIIAVFWGVAIIGSLLAANEVIDSTGEAAKKSTRLVKWVVIGGVLYYGGKAVGVIK